MNLGLTVAQLKCLYHVAGEGCTNLKNLAASLNVSPSNVTGIVERLVEQGLVSREGSPDDRRVLLVRTTDQGNELLGKLRETRVGHMSQILAGTTNEDLNIMLQAFTSMLQAVENYTATLASRPNP
ncbi:MAG: MarR family transcriptional regulator [Dehalococcoidales bacterium]|nr:MarR family transcriptional regulator [Dehalococcoidales bacterium]